MPLEGPPHAFSPTRSERDELRDKEVKVHSSAVSHYQGEVSHWREEFERLERYVVALFPKYSSDNRAASNSSSRSFSSASALLAF
jgi:hypothetical protein